MKNFVSPEWLFENLDNKDIVLVDCRADLFDRDYGKRVYEESHIKGAFFFRCKKKTYLVRSKNTEAEVLFQI